VGVAGAVVLLALMVAVAVAALVVIERERVYLLPQARHILLL